MHRVFIFAAAAAALTVFVPADAEAEEAMAYCWFNRHDYYFCYGPTQKTDAGEKKLSKSLTYSGCRNPSRRNDYTRAGVHGGAWYDCGRKLESYHASPNRIGAWLNSQ